MPMGNQHRKKKRTPLQHAFGENKPKFTAIPDEFILSECFRTLKPSSKNLYFDLCHQYRPASNNSGGNNGDLCISKDYMLKKYRWPAATLQRARDELMSRKIILRSGFVQNGHRTIPIYALSTHSIDYIEDGKGNPKHELKPTNKPPDSWKEWRAN